MNKNNYTLLVNSTDSFEDCWFPFFTLFNRYWPDYKGKVYLNTETKSFTYPGIDIISIRNIKNTPTKKISWSECLIRALESIDDEIILYMQEDYFIKSAVLHNTISKFADIMMSNDIDCIHLTDQNTSGPFLISDFDDLWLIDKNAPYRVSCQAGLWKKSVLLQYIRSYENPWQFEKYGTRRSKIFDHKFYTVNREKYRLNKSEIIPYIFTGIIRGCWFEEVIDLFEKNEIMIDFGRRGFVCNAKKKSFMSRIKNKIDIFPAEVRSQIELIKLKLS